MTPMIIRPIPTNWWRRSRSLLKYKPSKTASPTYASLIAVVRPMGMSEALFAKLDHAITSATPSPSSRRGCEDNDITLARNVPEYAI